ncbi:MAG TPA: DUF2784 domain-containing protein [Terriglobales bacterium]|nr:DUF2784 domain-containing protein [Terriglobales bacterium]
MNLYSVLATGVLVLHLLFIMWVISGVFFTRNRPLLRWFHIGSLVYGILLESLDWSCPLTQMENWLQSRAGTPPYQGGFLLHYLDALIYPDVSPSLLVVCGVAVCIFNLGIYAVRFRR